MQTIHSLLVCILVIGLGLLGACSPSNPPKASDPEQAKQYLIRGLEAWKQGSKSDSLQKPAILFLDRDWSNQLSLTDYQLTDSSKLHGYSYLFSVQLWLEDSSGRKLEKKIVYSVGTDSKIVITRSEMEPF